MERRSSTARNGRTGAVLVLFALFLLTSLATRALSLRIGILDVDEAAHIVGSLELMRGSLLYTDFVNNKPPLLYVYYALAQILFGRGMFALHLLRCEKRG